MFARVHPGVGLGRVGNSPTEIFLGPEAPGYPRSLEDPFVPTSEHFTYKDGHGRLKRQVVRFRVYLYNENQRGVGYTASPEREVTLEDSDIDRIEWTVTLANTKASTFRFEVHNLSTKELRNKHVKDRESLCIKPSPVTISGSSENFKGGSVEHQFDDGHFLGTKVNLGELRTDSVGRLVVCGGHGLTGSVQEFGAEPLHIEPFNNDGWWDDISDGPVECNIHFKNGDVLTAEQGSIHFGPPKYAPTQVPSTNFYHVMKEIAEDRGFLPGRPQDCVYYRDIHPILSSAVQHTWVSQASHEGHRERFGTLEIPLFTQPAPKYSGEVSLKYLDIRDPETKEERDYISKQVQRFCSDAKLRKQIFKRMRVPLALGSIELRKIQDSETFMPLPATEISSVTQCQYEKLRLWSEGHFTVGERENIGSTFNTNSQTDIGLDHQPAALDKAGLEHASAHALNPGIEFGMKMKSSGIYKSAFRLNEQVMRPGDIGKGMALPWHCDFWACERNWWPTSRPIEVISLNEYLEFGENSDSNLPRKHWDRGFKGMKHFVDDNNWAKLGVVVPMPGRGGFKVCVESERHPDLNPLGDEPGDHIELPHIQEKIVRRYLSTL